MDKATLERKGYSVAALRGLARNQLPRLLFDLIDGGAGDEITMRRNEAALAAMELVPTLLAGPSGATSRSSCSASTTLPGHYRSDRICPADLASRRARGGARRGAVRDDLFDQPRLAVEPRGDRRRDPGAEMDETFLYKDRGLTKEFAARAAAAGYHGLILTVDNQVVAGRDRDARNGASFPLRWGPRRVADFARRPGWLMRMRATPSPRFANYGARSEMAAFGPLMVEQLDPDIGWRDVDWLRNLWRGPLILKGILHPGTRRARR